MSEHKLLKFLSKEVTLSGGNRTHVPVVITDSKGSRLSPLCRSYIDSQIRWWFRKGRTTKQGLEWLRQNIHAKIAHLNNISLYVWLGTCDLTEYQPPFVYLCRNLDDIVLEVKSHIQDIVNLLQQYPACKLTFLEIPPYSIYLWNQKHCHTELQQFIAHDKQLLVHILELNRYIKETNDTLGTNTPKLSADIYHPNNTSKKEKNRTVLDQYNFKLYQDGIHSGTLLSKVWLRKIANKVKADCWEDGQ